MKADKDLQCQNRGKSYDAAVKLKADIDSFWRKKGENPNVLVEPVAKIGKELIYAVRSDMIDGRPFRSRSMPKPIDERAEIDF